MSKKLVETPPKKNLQRELAVDRSQSSVTMHDQPRHEKLNQRTLQTHVWRHSCFHAVHDNVFYIPVSAFATVVIVTIHQGAGGLILTEMLGTMVQTFIAVEPILSTLAMGLFWQQNLHWKHIPLTRGVKENAYGLLIDEPRNTFPWRHRPPYCNAFLHSWNYCHKWIWIPYPLLAHVEHMWRCQTIMCGYNLLEFVKFA